MKLICRAKSPIGKVLVIHSWWGLTDSFHDYGRQLADEGFAVGLSDLFDGQTASNIEEAKRLRRMRRKTPMYVSLTSDIEELLSFREPRTGRVAVVGFSMGGHWAVWLSQQPSLPISSTVLYYAARAGSFAGSKSSYLAHFAGQDPWVSVSARRNMERALKASNRPYTVFEYPGTSHWFAESARSDEFDAPSASLAFQRTLTHLEQTPT